MMYQDLALKAVRRRLRIRLTKQQRDELPSYMLPVAGSFILVACATDRLANPERLPYPVWIVHPSYKAATVIGDGPERVEQWG